MEKKKIEFDKKIYPVDIIRKSVKEYSSVADIELEEKEDKTIVSFTNVPEEYEAIITDEFANFVLALSLDQS